MTCRIVLVSALAVVLVASTPSSGAAQGFGTADAEAPGDAMIRAALAARTARVEAALADDLRPHDDARRATLRGCPVGTVAS